MGIDINCNNNKLNNFHAFSKLYGYVRFFYPGDEAAKMNWDTFAVYGMKKVEYCKNDDELRETLNALFHPFAPGIEIHKKEGTITFNKGKIIPADTNGLQIVAWQHKGIELNDQHSYKSIRLNRFTAPENLFGTITNSVEAGKFRGKKIKLKAAVKTEVEGESNHGHLWLRVDRENQIPGFFENMDKNPITSNDWKEYEITGEVAEDAIKIYFGCFLSGEGSLLVDDFHLCEQNGSKWNEIKINNPDFENDKPFLPPQAWTYTKDDYHIFVAPYEAFKGKHCVMINSNISKQLFDKHSVPGDYFTKDISDNLVCVIPLALYSDSNGTLPRPQSGEFDKLKNELDEFGKNELNGNNKYVRLADIAITWNVIQHFYPYFDLFNINWEAALLKYLNAAYGNNDEFEFTTTLNKLMAEINDGHAGANFNKAPVKFQPPVILDFVENKFVVSKVLNKETNLKEGDLIIEIDGDDIKEKLDQLSKEISSATEQWRMHIIASRVLLGGDAGSYMKLKVKRDSEILELKVQRSSSGQIWIMDRYPEYRPENITKLTKGIYYINLEKASMSEIDSLMPVLEKQRGIIFDLRGYPNSNHEVIEHLTDKEITSAKWNIPQIIYPDRENIVGYDTSGRWEMKPKLPKLNGKIVFLTNGSAISYAESFMGIIEAYKLADIVGEPTAGTNGNVNPISLPGGYRVMWTGMKVLKHDGSQHHGIGIQPTHLVHRTLKGVKEKRDEFFEKAVEIIEQSSKN